MAYETEGMPMDEAPDSSHSSEPSQEQEAPSKVEFPPPEGMREPKEGEEMAARCKYTYKDGNICLTEFAGHKMPGYEEGEQDGGDMGNSDDEIAALGMGQE